MLSLLGATEPAIVSCGVEVADSVGLLESVTVIVARTVPAAVGVPEIAPVELLIDNPPGSELALYL
jgi:hypothetical protein